MSWARRFRVRGVFWRQLLRWAVLNVPLWAETPILAFWALLFMLLWKAGRRGATRSIAASMPGSWALTNFFRTYAVFYNFAWSIADNVRFKEWRVAPDWDFVGIEHFRDLEAREGGAIILTAHMGSYDLGAHLFSEISKRRIVMVRAPEADPETQRYEEELHGRTVGEGLKIDFSTRASDLALDLLAAVRDGAIVAVQGDRVTPGIASFPATLFGKRTHLPSGPFALAMAARVPIYPVFIVRRARQRYRLIVREPIEVVRTRDRNEAFERAMALWTAELERVVRPFWFQWFTFDAYREEQPR